MSGEPEPDVVDAGSDDDGGGAACASDSKDARLYALGVELGSVTASGWALRQEEEASERGEDVLLTFSLPDGSVDVRSVCVRAFVCMFSVRVKRVRLQSWTEGTRCPFCRMIALRLYAYN